MTSNAQLAPFVSAKLTTAELEKVLYTWNDTALDFSGAGTIHELVAIQAKKTPQKTAVHYEGFSLTYAELDRKSSWLAQHLLALGAGPGKLAGLYIHRSLEMVIGLLGILKAGSAYIPIDPDFPAARIKLMLADADPPVIVTQDSLLANIDEGKFATVCLDSATIAGMNQQSAENGRSGLVTPDDLAYVIYTSGSTGRPKGVQIPHRAAVNFLKSMQREPGLHSSDRLLAVTTLSFDISLLEILLPLISGAQVIIASRAAAGDGRQLQEMLTAYDITMMQATPSTWQLLLYAGWTGKSNLTVLCGGEALSPDLAARLTPRCRALWNMYGPTETTVWSTIKHLKSASGPVGIGRPIANTQIFILDDEMQPVGLGEIGHLFIGGLGLARGYLGRPKLTTDRFLSNPFADTGLDFSKRIYKTGDLASYKPDGQIMFHGRDDNQVKIRGYRIELGDIDAVLSRHPDVANNVTIAFEFAPGDLRLVTYFVPEPGLGSSFDSQLRSFLKKELPEYMLPAHFVVADRLPLTPNGKLDRKALPDPRADAAKSRIDGEDFVTDGSKRQSELPPLSAEDRQKILYQWNETRHEYQRESTMHMLVAEQARRTPDSIALTFGDDNFTYVELDRRANQMAHHLRTLGVDLESLVALYVQRSADMVVAILGIMKAGGAYVPIDPDLPPARVKLMLDDAQPVVVVTQEKLLDNLDPQRSKQVCLDRDRPLIDKQPVSPPVVEMTSENLAYVIYTSGSTGIPKGVPIVHRSLANHLDSKEKMLRFAARDHLLATTTISFDPSVWEIFLPLTRGAHLTIAPQEAMVDGARLQRMIEDGGVTLMRGTPSNWRLLLASGWKGKADLKAVCGGEELTPDLARQIRSKVSFMSNGYGPTEITIAATFSIIEPAVEQITIGRPHLNTQIYILDEELEPVPIGSTGEIYISGEGVSPRGYLNQPELTAERFIPNPFATRDGIGKVMYKSGDLGSYLPDGRILFRGRNDTQVKIRGYRIELGDVEAAVGRHPAVANNVTVAYEYGSGDRRLVAYLVPQSGHEIPDAGQLRQFLRTILPDYMMPARFIVLAKLPLTPNGKIDRLALPAPDHFAEELSAETVPPRSDLEKSIAGLFGEVLKLTQVDVYNSFFELGGNSLLAARLIYLMEQRLQTKISLRDFLAYPNVNGLAAIVRESQTAETLEEKTDLLHQTLHPTADTKQEAGRGESEDELLQQSNLTRGQFLMWMGQQMNPESPLYNVVHAFTIHGQLDIGAFQQAFQALVDHHDALRTVFNEINGVPFQTVLEQVAAPIEVLDYAQLEDPYAAFQAFLDERQMRIMPMDQPLFDAVLIKLAVDRFAWYLCQHHIITDAVSSELLFERLGHYYQLAFEDRLDEIVKPPQYREFVDNERAVRQTPEFQQAVAYWRDKYGSPLPPTEFYGKSSSKGSTLTARIVQDLGVERSAKLRAIAKEGAFASPSEDMSLFTVFSTLLFSTIHRLDGRHTLRIGTPFHGRPTTDSLDVAGLFIEMGVLQVQVEGEETFATLGEKVMNEILDGLSHVQPGISRSDINRAYDVILNFIQASFHEFAGLPVGKEPVQTRHIDADHNMRLQITDYDSSGSFTLLFDLKADLFGENEGAWLVKHFLKVVDAFIDAYTRPLNNVVLLDDAERQKLLVDFNQTEADYPCAQTVVALFEQQAARTPESAAAVEGDQQLSYHELNQRANQLAYFLQEQGVGPEIPVSICMERSLDVFVAIWGVLKAGGAYIPIDPTYPKERIAYILSDATSLILLTNESEVLSGLELAAPLSMVDLSRQDLSTYPVDNPQPAAQPDHLVYMIYTSGSTGKPKGTLLTHRGLMNYAWWARTVYQNGEVLDFPLYSSLAFDLTVTSIFVPLLSGGRVVVYRESKEAPGMEFLSVFEDDAVDIVKLTPAHLRLVRELELTNPRIRKLIVGGEDFKTDLALAIHELFAGSVEIYNEYGPTEAVVGCMIHRYDPLTDSDISVPIGTPAANTRIYLLDQYDQPVPPGIIGEIVISSDGVARGYHQRPLLSAERFGSDPFRPGARLYRTGDIARWNEKGMLVFLGRNDHQVKIGSARIELGEIETTFMAQDGIQDVVVNLVQFDRHLEEQELFRCLTCGLPSNYPDVTFNEEGVCNLCTDFDAFRDDVFKYFKTMEDLQEIVDRAKSQSSGQYDCMMLYSGGKDSTYVLSQLVEMDLRVLAFSLDNGYISEEALDNVRRITDHLGVDLIIGTTPHMNAIFADSLERYSNVCQGCYKTIYTLSMNLARKKGIKYIFTGLSRGQLFETRLDELFRNRIFGVQQMDDAVLAARKIYHSVDDAVHRLLDVSMFRDDRVFEEIQFVDYFRYTEVELDELYSFLSTRVPWIRPQDTGRSTNCLINEAGIYVHQTERGYHNYALPYSWDVRLGHKTRAEAMEELDDDIRLPLVRQYLNEVDYSVKEWHADQEEQRLAAYFIAKDDALTIAQIRKHLGKKLPAYMMPAYFVRLQEMPLTENGKIDRRALPNPIEKRPELDAAFVAPQSQLEIGITDIWSQTLNVQRVGIHDNFFDLGGASIPAVQIVARISDQYKVDFPVRSFFENPTVATQSIVLEELLISQLETMSDEEVEQLLAELGD